MTTRFSAARGGTPDFVAGNPLVGSGSQPRHPARVEATVLIGAAGARANRLSHRPSNVVFRDASSHETLHGFALAISFKPQHSHASDAIAKFALPAISMFFTPPILDRFCGLDYTRRFESVQLLAPRGRVLCRNARFNRKCAVATRHTVFARA